MDINFRKLLHDPKLSELFQRQSGLDNEVLEECLEENDPSMFWQFLELEEILVVHHREGADESCFGVYGWGGLYFSWDKSQDLLAGPFTSPEVSASKVSQLSLAELNDTEGLKFEVRSSLPTHQALDLIGKLISEGETLELNEVTYRHEALGYVKV